MDTTAIAIVAANNAAQQAALNEVQRQQCVGWMPSFDAVNATAEQARMYASCVSLVYPEPLPEALVLWIKFGIVVCLFAPFIGALVNEYDKIEGALVGFMVAIGIWGGISIILLAIGFLLYG